MALIDYEVDRIREAHGRGPSVLMLHELVVDTLIPYGLSSVIIDALDHIRSIGIGAGVETRNLPHVGKELGDYGEVIFGAPFNSIGFQMSPSRESYEDFVRMNPGRLIAFSVLAGGLLRPIDALSYVARYRDSLLGVAIGVSREDQLGIFTLARELLK
jgi:hypothetical protein